MTDLALLSNGMLKGQDLSKFIERTVGLINYLFNSRENAPLF